VRAEGCGQAQAGVHGLTKRIYGGPRGQSALGPARLPPHTEFRGVRHSDAVTCGRHAEDHRDAKLPLLAV
jgi:hypothetical protein